MELYQLRCTITFTLDVSYEDINMMLSRYISSAMLIDDELKKLHEMNMPKFYIFSMPFPIEETKIYVRNRIYVFDIRSFKKDIILKFKTLLPMVNPKIQMYSSEIKVIKQKHISKLISLTPAIATLNEKCWTKEDGLELLMERAHNNAVKKAKILFGDTFTEPSGNFIECISQLNLKPIKFKYKNTSLLGSKFEIVPKSDDVSQSLAWVTIGAGLLEKNSQGYGFCILK